MYPGLVLCYQDGVCGLQKVVIRPCFGVRCSSNSCIRQVEINGGCVMATDLCTSLMPLLLILLLATVVASSHTDIKR